MSSFEVEVRFEKKHYKNFHMKSRRKCHKKNRNQEEVLSSLDEVWCLKFLQDLIFDVLQCRAVLFHEQDHLSKVVLMDPFEPLFVF